jgi:hypothetical protein
MYFKYIEILFKFIFVNEWGVLHAVAGPLVKAHKCIKMKSFQVAFDSCPLSDTKKCGIFAI